MRRRRRTWPGVGDGSFEAGPERVLLDVLDEHRLDAEHGARHDRLHDRLREDREQQVQAVIRRDGHVLLCVLERCGVIACSPRELQR